MHICELCEVQLNVLAAWVDVSSGYNMSPWHMTIYDMCKTALNHGHLQKLPFHDHACSETLL